MGSVRTRKQQAEAAQTEHEGPLANGAAKMNGIARTVEKRAAKEENIFLFVPNLIGYLRVVLTVVSLYYMPLHPRRCSFLYSVSCLLDALDGIAARRYNQSTVFGAVLDMVTDRCTTACLLVFLSSAFPSFAILFQGLISLDLASHYMHMYATLTMSGSGVSHKKVDSKRSWILHLYYTNRTVLFIFCALNELFFIALYLLSFSSPLLVPTLLDPAGEGQSAQPANPAHPAPTLFALKGSAAYLEMQRANKMDSTVPWILAGISAPVMLGKQIINVIQLIKASRWLAEGDRAARAKARKTQ